MKKNSKPGVVVYFDMRPAMKRLTAAQKGILFEAIMDYADDGVLPEFDDIALQIVWDFIQPRLDDDSEKYNATVNARKEAADKRWNKDSNDANASCADAKNANADFAMQTMPTKTKKEKEKENKNNNNEGEDKRARAARFTPPNAQEVAAFAKEHGYTINAEQFVDFYAAKGWRVGNTPMKDWRAAVRNWVRRDHGSNAPPGKRTGAQQYTQRAYNEKDLEPNINEFMEESRRLGYV